MKALNEDSMKHDKLKESMHVLLGNLELLHFYPPDRVGFRGKLLHLAGVCLIVQPTIAILENWNHWSFNTRVSTIDNVAICFGVLCMLYDLLLMPQKTKLLLDVIESKFTLRRTKWKGSENDMYKEKCSLVDEMTLEGYRTFKATGSMLKYMVSCQFMVPISGLIYYFLKSESVEKLPLLFKFYSPFSMSLTASNIYEYLILSAIQLFFAYYAGVLATAIHQMQMLSLCHIRIEMKLFHLNMSEINTYCNDTHSEVTNQCHQQNVRTEKRKTELYSMMRELTQHHQSIFRMVRMANDAYKFRLFYMNTYICLQVCLAIFIFLKGQLLLKLKYGVTSITIIMVGLIISENGQKFQDEGDKLREALYNCNWQNRPKWFTSTLQILMTRNNQLPRIMLFNIFTLNRNNMTVVMRGAYSYFNLLNNFSN